MEESKRLTAEDIFNLPEAYTEEVEIQRGNHTGTVLIRMIESMDELDTIRKQADRLKEAGRIGAPPFTRPTGIADILAALTMNRCCIEPELSFSDALRAIDSLGPAASRIVTRIGTISGITDNAITEVEEELKGDSFPVPDPGLVVDLS